MSNAKLKSNREPHTYEEAVAYFGLGDGPHRYPVEASDGMDGKSYWLDTETGELLPMAEDN